MSEITKRIKNTHTGQILFISDFSDLNGNEKVISRALSSEEKRGNLIRLANGVYLRPKTRGLVSYIHLLMRWLTQLHAGTGLKFNLVA